MKANEFWKNQTNPNGIALTTTLESTGSATCILLPTGRLIFDLDTCAVDKYVEVTLPFKARVIGAKLIHGDTTASTVEVDDEDANAITDAMAPSTDDKAIEYASTIDDAYSTIDVDEGLRLLVATDAFTGIVIVDLQMY
jgi:hypothetical protein